MRTTLLALAASAALVAGASAASAMPTNLLAGADDAPQVTLVAEGCGPGFRRGAVRRLPPVRWLPSALRARAALSAARRTASAASAAKRDALSARRRPGRRARLFFVAALL